MNALSLRTVILAGSLFAAALGLAGCSDGAESRTEESTSEALVAAAGPATPIAADAGPVEAGPPKSDCSSERAALNAATEAVNAATDALNECAKNHPRSECSAQIAAYNAAVGPYNAAVAAYNACIKKKKPVAEATDTVDTSTLDAP